MVFGIQVKIYDKARNVDVWRDVRPTGGQPYRYETREEAERMARFCYDVDPSVVRVVEVVS